MILRFLHKIGLTNLSIDEIDEYYKKLKIATVSTPQKDTVTQDSVTEHLPGVSSSGHPPSPKNPQNLRDFQPQISVLESKVERQAVQASTGGTFKVSELRKIGKLHTREFLVVDANSTIGTLILSIIKKLGYKARLVENYKDIKKALSERYYDFVFMNEVVPGIDPIELIKIIRSSDHSMGTVIIVATAPKLINNKDLYIEAGANHIASQPLDHVQLTKLVKRSLRNH